MPPGSEAAFSAAFRPDDHIACVWTDETNPHLLRASFDVMPDEFDSAIEAALHELRSVVRVASVMARPTVLVAMADEAQARWAE